MRQVPAFVCEKCGHYGLGEKSAPRILAHERMPVRGVCTSLDGLIVKTGYHQNYLVFRRLQDLSQRHEAMYSWDNYLRPSLRAEKRGRLPKKLERRIASFLQSFKGFTAQNIVGRILDAASSEDSYKNYEELSETEFQRVAKKLKKMHPKLYAGTVFKRKLRYRRSSKK